MAGPRLGYGKDLRVMLLNRGATNPLAELDPSTGSFSRDADKTSTLTMEGILSGADSGDWGQIYQWATEILVLRDGRDQWCGPVTDVAFERGKVSVDASDRSAWWDRRRTVAQVYTSLDAVDIFMAVEQAAMDRDPVANLPVVKRSAGPITSRTYIEADQGYASDDLADLAKTQVDWTVFGRTLLVGGQADISSASESRLLLMDEHWTKPPGVAARGSGQATEVVVKGKDGLVGIARSSADKLAFYGLLTRVIDESQSLLTQADVDAAARSYIALYEEPYYIVPPAGAGLAPSAPVTVADLIPGMLIRVDSRSTSRRLVSDFRLTSVKVDFGGGVSIDLAPVGASSE